MNSFDTKYKDRKPEETIAIIENFFKNKGYQITYDFFDNSFYEGIYSCCVYIKLNNKIILHSNGKGINKIFAQASGLGELYERFCSKLALTNNFISFNNFIEKNYKKNNYYLHHDEKILNFQELKNSNVIIRQFLNYFFNSEEEQEQYINNFFQNKIIGYPFKGFNVKGTKYFDLRLLHCIDNSNGMSAGNTIEEALNQGMSEILERYCVNEFFKKPNLQYYLINPEKINNKKIQNILKKFQEKNYKIFIIDFSYTFSVPVVGFLINDLKNYNSFFSFGSFPDFEIALERCLTELIQGRRDFQNSVISYKRMEPYKKNFWFDHSIKYGSCITDCTFFPEEAILNAIEMEKPSDLYQKNKTNKELNEYYKNICNNLNLNLYYADMSSCKEIKAIYLFSDNLLLNDAIYELGKNLSKENKKFLFKVLLNRINILNNILNNSYKKVKELLNEEKYYFDYLSNNFNITKAMVMLLNSDILNPYDNNTDLTIPTLMFLQDNNYEKIWEITTLSECFYFSSIRKLEFIKSYKNNPQLLLKLSEKLNYNITQEDIDNVDNYQYILNKYFLEKLEQELNSEYYEIYLNSFLNN